jgi:penicillin-insensitive murein endopeptidase
VRLELAASCTAFLVAGCLGTPTPLAPGLQGSVGVPHHGVLTNGEELPARGPGYERYRPRSSHYWGNPRLIATLTTAAAAVAEAYPGGAPLVVGDISGRYGGKIPHHRSHRTGRDADLLFYTTTPAGAPVKNPGFLRFDGDLLSRLDTRGHFLRLDAERTWGLVRELLSAGNVQWLFVSRKIEALLISYARARGEDPALVWHAETVLLQPGDSTAHDDHFHMRLACTPTEAVAGCEGGGPYWEWLPVLPELGELTAAQFEAIARDDPFETLLTEHERS